MITTCIPPPPESDELRRCLPTPPQIEKRRKKSARRAIEPTSTPTISEKRMSKFRTWLSSWAMTPWSSSRSSFCNRPTVMATDACAGSRPVANALGAVSSMRYTRGIGRLDATASSWTTFHSCGISAAVTSRAPDDASTRESPM